jgi:hypothetical protein
MHKQKKGCFKLWLNSWAWYFFFMEIVIPSAKTDDFAAGLLQGWVTIWVKACDTFRQWEREELIQKEPSSETLARHKKLGSALIRTAYMLQAVMEDPDYPARAFLPEVRGKLMQLEDARDMIHDPMSDQEADVILAKVFPDGPRAGSPA